MTDIEALAKELVEANQRLEAINMMNTPDKYEDRVAMVLDREKTRIRIAVAAKKIDDYCDREIREQTALKTA